MVVAAGRDEQDVARRPPPRHVARLEDDVEAEDADVDLAHPVDVRRPQVDVSDPYVRVDRVLRPPHRLDRPLRPAHGASNTTAVPHGSRARKPSSRSAIATPP